MTQARRRMVRRVRRRVAVAVTALLALLAAALLIAMRATLDVDPPPSLVLAAMVLLGLAIVGALDLARRAARTVERLFAHQDHLMLAVAHEIGSPLSHAMVILDEGISGVAPPGAAIEEAMASVVDLSALVEDLVETARIMSGATDPPSEEMRLDEVVRSLPGLDHVVRADIRFETAPTVVRGSPHLVRRAVSNLVRNAAAHGCEGPGGEIRIRVDEVGVTVHDDGPGIPPAQLSQLRHGHDTLAALPRRRDGLGLPLATWVANVHDGQLVLRNRPEGGFEAQLRIHGAPAPPSPRAGYE